jgi:hypothetical protein
VNQVFTTGRSPGDDRREFAIVAGASQLLTLVLSPIFQWLGAKISASLASGSSLRAVQVWSGAGLAYVRNLPQTWVFSLAVRGETKDPSDRQPVGWRKRAIQLAVWIMMSLGVAGSVIGLAAYPLALLVPSMQAFAHVPYLLEIIQGATGAGQGWSGTLLNRSLRNRRSGTKVRLLSADFVVSCALAMAVTGVSSAALQFVADSLTQGATNPLAVQGLAALMSAAVGAVRGGIVAPFTFALIGGNVRAGFRVMGNDIVNLVRFLTRRR